MDIEKLATLLGINELPSYIQQVDQNITSIINSTSPALKQSGQRVALAPSKRIRPALVIAIAAAGDKKIDEGIIAAASAIELIHIASLVHDDIIDNAKERRGIATINSQEGVSTAILVGDYLVGLAGAQAALAGKDIAQITASAFAIMSEGQAQELADGYNIKRTVESYLATIGRKTARLMAAVCQVGGLGAGMSEAELLALNHYGEAFGMTFQLVDDLLDILSTPKLLGKPTGNDIKEGVYTLPVLLTLQGPYRQQLLELLVPRSVVQLDLEAIAKILYVDGSLQKTLTEAQKYAKAASNAIGGLNSSSVIAGLAKLPHDYLRVSLTKQKTLTT